MKKQENLFQFAKELINICNELHITPVLWGGLAYFYYSKDKNYVINDIDFLVPNNEDLLKLKKAFQNRGLKIRYLKTWNSLIVKKGETRIEFDTIEMYAKNRKSKKAKIKGILFNIISLNALIECYKYASKVSQDKPKEHLRKYKELLKLRK